jgi:hypothetical protein
MNPLFKTPVCSTTIESERCGEECRGPQHGYLQQQLHDRTREIVRRNLSRIKLISVAGPLLCDPRQSERVMKLLRNRQDWGIEQPLVMLALHDEREESEARRFQSGPARELARFTSVWQKGHNETSGHVIELFRREFQPNADSFIAKRHSLLLTRRGGKGKPNFVSPFLGGQGTTCGEWTRPMVRTPDGTLIKGFTKADVTVGFCPAECTHCYLNMPYTDGMDVAMNLEDMASELKEKWRGYPYPINFGETGGLVEYDEWFADQCGDGSMMQFVIDACASAGLTPFFLTKIRYPGYLRFDGKVQVGISLVPEPVRQWLAPNGSPTEELLESLAWAWSAGARDPVIRMSLIWQQRDEYPEILERCRELLGRRGWRLTLDILRFTPTTALIIDKRYPEAALIFANEIAPNTGKSLTEIVREANSAGDHVKKIRPPAERQGEIYIWFRKELDRLGCENVMLTACKGDPAELTPLVRAKIIQAMPCACYGCGKERSIKA